MLAVMVEDDGGGDDTKALGIKPETRLDAPNSGFTPLMCTTNFTFNLILIPIKSPQV